MTKRIWIWLFGIVSFLILVAICLMTVPTQISEKLKVNIDDSFLASGIDVPQYDLDGRDVIFTGDVSINYNRAAQFNLAREVDGVRNIIDKQVVYEPQPAFGQILIENGQVKFTGGFKNLANLELITKLLHQYFPDYEIIVLARTSERMITLQQVLDYEYLFERFQGNEIWFEFSDRQVVMNGRFKSEHDRELAEQKILSQISKQTRYINDIKITGSEESERIIFEKKAGVISISGVLVDNSLKQNLIALFKGYYPNSTVNFNVSIDENLEYVAWHDKLGYLVPELDRIIEGNFKFYTEEIVLEGLVDDVSTKAGLISRISEAIEDSEIIDRLKLRTN